MIQIRPVIRQRGLTNNNYFCILTAAKEKRISEHKMNHKKRRDDANVLVGISYLYKPIRVASAES